MRPEWSKKEDNNYTEKEIDIFNDKIEKGDQKLSVNDEKIKEMYFVDIEDYFQIEVIEGETVFVCHYLYRRS